MTITASVEASSPTPEELDARWALVLPHRDRLRRIAARRLACRDEVEDVVQEAMLRAVTFERLDPAYAAQFLSTVTVRLCADVQRDRVRQLRVGVRDALRSVDSADPNDTLLDTAEARWLYGECLKLPPRESAVMLARASGMSVKETAVTLGVGTKSAEAALTKARHRMRRVAQSASVAVLGVLKRIKYASTPGAVATTVAATVTAVTVGGVVGGIVTHHAPPARTPAAAAPAAPVERLVTPAREAVQHPAPPPVVKRAVKAVRKALPAPAPVVRDDDPDIETPPIGDPDRTGVGTREGVRVEDQREEETFEESLFRCVEEALTIDPSHPVCDPE